MAAPAIIQNTTVADQQPRPGLARARRWLLWAFIIFIVGTFTAMLWDGLWHLTYSFDGFFSPPHIYAYLVASAVAAIVNVLVFRSNMRRWFGRGFRVPVITFEVPGALFLLGAGLVMLGFAGLVLDNFWHTNFGLNETNWSSPHAMIGWSLLIIGMGFLSARLALAREEGKPLGLGWKIVMAFLLVAGSARPFMGPLDANNSPATVIAVSNLPGLAATPEYQQVSRIYLEHNLTRANPLVVVLAPFWAGAALAFMRKIDARPLFLLGVALLLSGGDRNSVESLNRYLPGLIEDRANYAAFPLIMMMAMFLLLRWVRVGERWAWALAGGFFALFVHWTFGIVPGGELLAIPAALMVPLGVAIGERAYAIVDSPFSFRAVLPIIAAGSLVPLLTGVIDFYLRSITP